MSATPLSDGGHSTSAWAIESVIGTALGQVPESLLNPLLMRAQAHRRVPALRLRDAEAERIVARLGVDADRVSGDRSAMLGCVLRSQWLDRKCFAFFAAYPRGIGVSLGAGLATNFQRLDAEMAGAAFSWVDVDRPEVIALKRQLVAETDRYRLLARDVVDPGWLGEVTRRRPAVVLAEGLLMYLARADVRKFFTSLARRLRPDASPVDVLFDYVSPFMARLGSRHPWFRATGAAQRVSSRFGWALRGARDLRQWDPCYRVVEEYGLLAGCGLGPFLIAAAHRLLTGGHHVYALAHVSLRRADAAGQEGGMRGPACP